MKRIIVTGCNGQLGREISNYYSAVEDMEIIGTDVDELDITNLKEVMALVGEIKPYAIINCAAYTAVDSCEEKRDLAFKINAIGPKNLAIAAREADARLVHISTDYVFKGDKKEPYVEWDKTNPQSVYGYTKEQGEIFVREFAHRYFIFRTAWLYGDGKNFVRTMLKLAETKDVVTVVEDQFGTPTSTLELVKAIDSLLFTDNYGLYHATCEGSTCWADFAREIFREAGLDVRVEGTTTEVYGAPADRPLNSILDNYMLRMVGGYTMSPWQEALGVYLKKELGKGEEQ